MLDWINSQINKLQPEILRPEDVASLPTDSYIPKFADIALPSVAVAFGLVVLRHIVDKTIVAPFGAYFNIEAKSTKDKPNKDLLLESEYNKCKSPRSDTITVLSKKSGLTEKQVTLWFQKRKKREKTSELKRLQDASWHFIFYIVMSWYGIYVLWDKSWFAKAINCWIGWPAQPVSNGIYWYYLIELGFYISAVYMLFTDHKRKDFTELIVHHMVTLFLMIISFNYNLLRVGSLVLCVHDQVDYFLSMAKIAMYCKKRMLADVLFVFFIIVWIATRLVIYPYVILYSVFIDLPGYADDSRPYTKMYDRSTIMMFVKCSLVVLQILHFIWTFLIIKSAAAKLTKGHVHDARSDNEESDDDDTYDADIDNDLNKNSIGNCNNGTNLKKRDLKSS